MSIEHGGTVGDLRPLGEGPVATVYAGRLGGAEVAVKVFASGFDRDTAAGLDRERKALETVRSERAILPVDEVIEFADGRAGLRTELCHGSLAGLLGSGVSLAVRDVLAVGQTVASALVAAHQVGVVHGGVTPHNVLYRRSGELVVADFGLALRRGFPRDAMHAVEYAAPETLRDDTLSEATDLYGLGAVLYGALTGAPPFPRRTGQQPGERILQVLRDPVPPLQVPGIPAELSEVVGRLLAKDPAGRPQDVASVAELFRRLYRAKDGRGVEFDDFAGAPQPPTAAPAPAGRTLVRSFGGPEVSKKDRKRIGWRPAVLVGLGAAVVGLTVVPLVISSGSQEELSGAPVAVTSARPSQEPASVSPGPNVNLVLAPPADLGDNVQLTWSADGDLDFAVIVAGERIDPMVLVANRQHSLSIPVDPARKYCFQVRATDGTRIYKTEPVPIRGARCNP